MTLYKLGQLAATPLHRKRTLLTNATPQQRHSALHAPASNQQSPHAYGRKLTPRLETPRVPTHPTGP